MAPKNKRAGRRYNPPAGKNPRSETSKQGTDHLKIRWKFTIIEKDGPWGFSNISEPEFWDSLLPKVKEFEKLTWAELFSHPHNHPIDKGAIINEAQHRLEIINQDDTDKLVSLAIGGLPRLWGIRTNDEFRILWWDPNHEICPSTR